MKRREHVASGVLIVSVGLAIASAASAHGLAAQPSAMRAEHLPAAALEWKVFRRPLTRSRRPSVAALDLVRGSVLFRRSGIDSLIGDPLYDEARRIRIPGWEAMLLPGSTGLATVIVGTANDGAPFLSVYSVRTYAEARYGGLGGFTRGCTTWATDDTCAAPDEGWSDFLQLAPDGVRTVTVLGVTVPVIDNVAIGTVRPMSRWPEVPRAMDRNRARWKADARRKAAAKKKAATKKTTRKRTQSR